MSPMFRAQRQVPGTLLILLLVLTLTTLFQASYTGSNDALAASVLSLLSLVALAVATDVVKTGFVFSSALSVLTYGRTTVFHGSLVLCSLTKSVGDKLVPLSLSAYVTTRTATGAIRKTIDFTVELFTILPRSTYSIKSEPELLEEGLLPPNASLPCRHSQEPFDLPLLPPTSLEAPSKAVVALANADPTETTLGSTCAFKPSRTGQRGVSLAAPASNSVTPNASALLKSSVIFPTLPNNSADCSLTGLTGGRRAAKALEEACPKGLNFVDVDKFRGSIATATAAPRRGRTSPPRIIIHEETSNPSFPSSGRQNYAASTASSSPYSASTATFQTTTPTTPCSSLIDIHHSDIIDREATTAPTPTPQLTPATNVKLPKNDGRRGLNEVVWWTSEEETQHVVGDHRADSGALEFEGEEHSTQNDDDWRWAKTVGKLRRTSFSTTSTEDETDSEEDDDEEEDAEDEQGFSTRAMRKTMRKSKRAAPGGAASRPFYGASTSAVVKGLLSQEQWDTLEQFEAEPSSPKKMVRSPSPASTRVEVEVTVPYWLSAPLPALPEAAPVEAKRLPRLRKLIKKLIPRNPFKNRSRAP